jgi:hypothetical protein
MAEVVSALLKYEAVMTYANRTLTAMVLVIGGLLAVFVIYELRHPCIRYSTRSGSLRKGGLVVRQRHRFICALKARDRTAAGCAEYDETGREAC